MNISRIAARWTSLVGVTLLLLAPGCSPEPDRSVVSNIDGGVTDARGEDVESVQCRENAECDTGLCREGECVAPTCEDGVQNGGETDVDCGGPECAVCEEGEACEANEDCASGACEEGTCRAASCDDGVKNGAETGEDCGGPECAACEAGGSCEEDRDCASENCEDGECRASACDDGVKNGEETDVDCGGPSCDGCSAGAVCSTSNDCESGVCDDGGSCRAPTCSDGVENGEETGVDCGGSECMACDAGEGCRSADDCESGLCEDGTCVAASCTDGEQNGEETAVDCGGPSCNGCASGETCVRDRDCQTGVCEAGMCAEPSCSDGVQNGDETDVDCGGSTCGRCGVGAACSEASDCTTGVCSDGSCRAPTCSDGVQNGDETAVDCGGPDCAGCGTGSRCRLGSDCQTGVCKEGSCAEATCSDGAKNGDETDVDCGGSTCPACGTGGSCQDGSDCTSGVCEAGQCAAPSCSDDVQNGDETDVDCGGEDCAACDPDDSCSVATDCTSGVCSSGTCEAPDCFDRVKNGQETDVDCGGADCSRCEKGASCQADSDCETDICVGGTCVECRNGETRTTGDSCGYKDRGTVQQVCQNNEWKQGSCSGVWYESCREILEDRPGSTDGTYQIDPDGKGGSDSVAPLDVHCDMTSDGGVGYTMKRFDDSSLDNDQDSYRQYCQSKGMEVIVPRTRSHAESIKSWNGGDPSNLVNVFPKYDGAEGLSNWEGRCQGQSCSFFIDESNSAGCSNFEPNGDNNTSDSLYRRDTGCVFGEWNDANNSVAYTGWVICSTNDAGPPVKKSCKAYRDDDSVHNASSRGTSGRYTVDIDGPSGSAPQREVYCDMQAEGGGWTLVTVNGTDGRPSSYSSNQYPRPGASTYGALSNAVSDVESIRSGAQSAQNYSLDAVDIFTNSNREFLSYVGGNTTDYIHGTLPSGCNYFDGSTWCEENTFGPFSVYRSDGSEVTSDAYACTTANQKGSYSSDEYDEFGLQLIDGTDTNSRNCHSNGNSSVGHQNRGRIYTTFESSSTTKYWRRGVHSHWNDSGDEEEPGYLMVR